MLQISVYDADNLRLALLPAVDDRSCQTAGIASDQESDSRIGLADLVHNFRGSVTAVIVHYNQFIRNSERIYARANSSQNGPNVGCFTQCRHNQGKLCERFGNRDRCQGHLRRTLVLQSLPSSIEPQELFYKGQA